MSPEDLTKQIHDIGIEIRKEVQNAVDLNKTQDAEHKARLADLETKQNEKLLEMSNKLDTLEAKARREQDEAKKSESFAERIKKAMTPEVITSIKNNVGSWSPTIPFEVKVQTPQVTTDNTSGVYYADRRDQISGYNLYLKSLRDLFVMGTTNLNSVDLPTEKSTATDGTAVQTEGATLGASDLLLDKTNLKVITVGAVLNMSQDSLDDLPGMSAWINRRLTDRLIKKENAQLITGTTYGIYTIAPVADPTDWNVANANLWNILGMAVGAALAASNSYPTAILLNPINYFQLMTASTAYGFINQNVTSATPLMIAGVPVYASEAITAGTYLLGDFSLASMFMKQAPQVQFGLNSTDFAYNNLSVKITERFAAGSELPKAFLKGTLAVALACGSA